MKNILLLLIVCSGPMLMAQWNVKLYTGAGYMSFNYASAGESSTYAQLSNGEIRYHLGSQIAYESKKNGVALSLDYGHINHPAKRITESQNPFHILDASLSYRYQLNNKWVIAAGPQFQTGFHNGLKLSSLEKSRFHQYGIHGGAESRLTAPLDLYFQIRYDGIGRTAESGYWKSLSNFLGIRYTL